MKTRLSDKQKIHKAYRLRLFTQYHIINTISIFHFLISAVYRDTPIRNILKLIELVVEHLCL